MPCQWLTAFQGLSEAAGGLQGPGRCCAVTLPVIFGMAGEQLCHTSWASPDVSARLHTPLLGAPALPAPPHAQHPRFMKLEVAQDSSGGFFMGKQTLFHPCHWLSSSPGSTETESHCQLMNSCKGIRHWSHSSYEETDVPIAAAPVTPLLTSTFYPGTKIPLPPRQV